MADKQSGKWRIDEIRFEDDGSFGGDNPYGAPSNDKEMLQEAAYWAGEAPDDDKIKPAYIVVCNSCGHVDCVCK